MNDTLFHKLQNFRSALNSTTLEREHVIDGLLASLLSKQNAFLLGVPGTGKSDLVRNLCKGIKDAKFFGYLLTPTTDPPEIFGPVAVTKLLQDEYTRDTNGYLPSANIAFLDELFRGSSAILNSLLTLLNERTFNNGKESIHTPIESIIAATNTWPDEEALQAFADRFLFRPTVDLLHKPVSKRILDQWALGITERPTVEEFLTLDELKELQHVASQIRPSERFLDAFGAVWSHLDNRNITVSDRRRSQILKFLQGWAVIQGDDSLHAEHMHDSLVHIVYEDIEDQPLITEILEQEIPTADRIFAEAKRAAAGIMTEYNTYAHKSKAKGLTELNDYVLQVRKFHKDINTVKDKVNQILDGEVYRMSVGTRAKGAKIQQTIQGHCDNIARAINELSN